jgi:hypothetical protein
VHNLSEASYIFTEKLTEKSAYYTSQKSEQQYQRQKIKRKPAVNEEGVDHKQLYRIARSGPGNTYSHK